MKKGSRLGKIPEVGYRVPKIFKKLGTSYERKSKEGTRKYERSANISNKSNAQIFVCLSTPVMTKGQKRIDRKIAKCLLKK